MRGWCSIDIKISEYLKYIFKYVFKKVKMKVLQSCPTLCDPMDYIVHGILQARIPEWVTFPFSRGSSQPRDWTQVSCITSGVFTSWATREAQEYWCRYPIPSPVDLPDPGIEPESPALQADNYFQNYLLEIVCRVYQYQYLYIPI